MIKKQIKRKIYLSNDELKELEKLEKDEFFKECKELVKINGRVKARALYGDE